MAIDGFNANFASVKAEAAQRRVESNKNKAADPVFSPAAPAASDSDSFTYENAGAQLLSNEDSSPTIEIQPGDTLTKISEETGVSIDEILAENPEFSDRNQIAVGANLKLPDGAKRTTSSFTSPNPFRPTNTDPTNDPTIDSPASYRIKPGDNLTKLAKLWGVNVADIVEANTGSVSDPNQINAGQYLSVPIDVREAGLTSLGGGAPAGKPTTQTSLGGVQIKNVQVPDTDDIEALTPEERQAKVDQLIAEGKVSITGSDNHPKVSVSGTQDINYVSNGTDEDKDSINRDILYRYQFVLEGNGSATVGKSPKVILNELGEVGGFFIDLGASKVSEGLGLNNLGRSHPTL